MKRLAQQNRGKIEAEAISYYIREQESHITPEALSQCVFIDIETVSPKRSFPDPWRDPVYSISIKPYGKPVVVVLLLISNPEAHIDNFNKFTTGVGDKTFEIHYRTFLSEKRLLEYFWNVLKPKFTFMLAWNGYQFDYPYLLIRSHINLIRSHINEVKVISDNLLPDWKLVRKISDRNLPFYFNPRTPVEFVFFDYMRLYRSFVAYKELESYRLDYIAREEIGEGKVDFDVRFYHEIPVYPDKKLVEYNAVDAILMEEIENKNHILPTLLEIARLSNLTPALALNASNILIGNVTGKLGVKFIDYIKKIDTINTMFKKIPE